ncbi:hypothetical protein [Streptomyces sp. NPDC002133]
MGADILAHARRLLPELSTSELRYLAARLADAPDAGFPVVESRGQRLR